MKLSLLILDSINRHNAKRREEGYDPSSAKDRAVFASDVRLRMMVNYAKRNELRQAREKRMNTRRIVTAIASIALTLFASVAAAQTSIPSPVPPTTQLAWNPPTNQTSSTYNATGFRLRVDAATFGADIPTSVFNSALGSYTVPFPSLTPGLHTLTVRAFNTAGESADSNTLSVNIVVVPLSPNNFRILIAGLDGTVYQAVEYRAGKWVQTFNRA